MHVQYRRCNKLERFSVAKRYLVLISRICAVLVGLIALIAFANAASWALITPAFNAPDEPDHFAYGQYLATTGPPKR